MRSDGGFDGEEGGVFDECVDNDDCHDDHDVDDGGGKKKGGSGDSSAFDDGCRCKQPQQQ